MSRQYKTKEKKHTVNPWLKNNDARWIQMSVRSMLKCIQDLNALRLYRTKCHSCNQTLQNIATEKTQIPQHSKFEKSQNKSCLLSYDMFDSSSKLCPLWVFDTVQIAEESNTKQQFQEHKQPMGCLFISQQITYYLTTFTLMISLHTVHSVNFENSHI